MMRGRSRATRAQRESGHDGRYCSAERHGNARWIRQQTGRCTVGLEWAAWGSFIWSVQCNVSQELFFGPLMSRANSVAICVHHVVVCNSGRHPLQWASFSKTTSASLRKGMYRATSFEYACCILRTWTWFTPTCIAWYQPGQASPWT